MVTISTCVASDFISERRGAQIIHSAVTFIPPSHPIQKQGKTTDCHVTAVDNQKKISIQKRFKISVLQMVHFLLKATYDAKLIFKSAAKKKTSSITDSELWKSHSTFFSGLLEKTLLKDW